MTKRNKKGHLCTIQENKNSNNNSQNSWSLCMTASISNCNTMQRDLCFIFLCLKNFCNHFNSQKIGRKKTHKKTFRLISQFQRICIFVQQQLRSFISVTDVLKYSQLWNEKKEIKQNKPLKESLSNNLRSFHHKTRDFIYPCTSTIRPC